MDALDELRVFLKGLGDEIVAKAGKDVGFAVWIETAGAWSYTSNCDRSVIVKAMKEWLMLTERALVKSPGRTENSRQRDDRLALERKCAEIGKAIGTKFKLGLFLFESDPSPISAYIANVEDFRERVANWVKIQERKS